ncbi:LolA family protein [Oceanobacillus saliphilus]|uniref:LolA family protein n=1 Tax=Oceanobacillus saliphilus TaxID=2925834 RepID=UPI00201D3DA7|nr:hypothetical protein [Oceanobacillus saliphilus]
MKFTWRKCVVLLSILTLLLGGCSQNRNVSAEEIIHNAIESEKDVTTYQGESVMKLYEGDEVIEHAILQEYVAGEKRKVVTEDQLRNEVVEVFNDGMKMLMYDQGSGQAHEMDMTELGALGGLSPKEQLKSMLESMKDSHSYEVVGEEKLLDFDTYHIKLKANHADDLLGDMDLWVEKKTWFVVKYVSVTGDNRIELEYTELDFSPNFSEGVFTIDIPEDVEIANLEDDFLPDTVTVEEAEEALGQPILLFPEEDVYLSGVQMYDFSEELNRYEVELTYNSKDDIPVLYVSVFPSPEDMEITEGEMNIRGNIAEYDAFINGIFWDEGGLRYSLLIMNPDIDPDEIVQLTEKMKFSSEK